MSRDQESSSALDGDTNDGDSIGDAEERSDRASQGAENGDGGAEPLRLLHLDGAGAREAVRSYAESLDRWIEVRGANDGRAAVAALREAPVECIVVEPGAVEDWGWFYRACREESGAPLVLYTLQDPSEVDANAVAAADTFVRKGQRAHREFLFEKVRGIVGGSDESTSVDAVADVGPYCVFTLDERGRILETHGDPPTVFGPAWTEAGSGETRLHERLASGLANGAAYRRRVDEALEAGAAIEGFRCEVAAGAAHRAVGFDSVPTGAAGAAARVEIYRDVTDLEDRIRDSERATRIVEEISDGLYMLDADGVYRYVNGAYADLVGYDPEELVGEHASVLMQSGDLRAGQEQVQAVLDGEKSHASGEVELVRKDGGTVEVALNFTTLPGENGTYDGIVGVARNITDRRRRERQLLQYRTLVEAAGDPMYVLDTEGFLELHNDAMAAFYGDPEADLVGMHAGDVTSDEGYRKGTAAVRKLLADEDRSWVRYEAEETGPDGNDRVYEVTVGLITDDAGEFVGSVGTFRDVTRRRLREEELDLLKQILTRVLRHNIRNRANVIEGHANLLANRLDGQDAALAETIVEKCQDLVETSEKVRTVERVIDGEGVTVEHDLGRVLADSVDGTLAAYPGADVKTDVPTGLRVAAIPKLGVAFQNLLENALEHGTAADGGEFPTVRLSAELAGDSVRVMVADDGPGIPDSEVEVLERSRETALEHSSGMGLWLVNWVVDKSGGDLRFDREDGTRAVVSLPRP
jgi:PAS domain S-box-containing protein